MTDGAVEAPRIGARERAAAIAALVLAIAAVVVGTVSLAGDLGRVVITPIALLVAVSATWVAATRTGLVRLAAGVCVVVGLGVVVAGVLTAEANGLGLAIVIALLAGSTLLGRRALRRDPAALKAMPVPGTPVGPARQGVLIMNLRSGGGKAERFGLEAECRERGIEPIVLRPGDDLLVLAQQAIERGADVIGMAGGDGSQALVASVAMGAGIPLVCIPAGTRNHFALDLGLDRNDVVGALDAFDDAIERPIDLAEVNGRVFVNNVSLGVYAKIVQSPEYRDAKRQTTAALLPELLGPGADRFDLRFTGPDGAQHDSAQIIQVSNNPYVLSSLAGFGSRARLDTGDLGIAAAEVHHATDIAAFVAAESAGRLDRFGGWTEWTAPTFTVESASPVEAGVDGEALLLDPPLQFRALPSAVRVRLPTHAPGYSPAALKAPSPWWSITALVRAAGGHVTPIEESLR
ncbi:diacylglycerol/lipid kinase family protein [Aquihabitans daechungensis]|uniref:diacylglycerol/lipid kinase family protein n=1 Tax=Aquihabitans daechungensis TaxID=1052257 RepID=UPI003BA1F042